MGLRLFLAKILAPKEIAQAVRYDKLIEDIRKDVQKYPEGENLVLQQILDKESGKSFIPTEVIVDQLEDKTVDVKESSQTRVAQGVMKLLFEGSEANLLKIIKDLGAKAYPAQIHRSLFPKGTPSTVSRTDIAWFLHLLDAMDVTRSKTVVMGRTRIRQFTLTSFGESLLEKL